ncbi:ribbon-helix-helix domain-containing protein [Streptococcus parasanguinis]|uniref:ribbon-helix-helix domain-containing protein n=1 Tax=Streptococcus parasanguinis TaxID=1318 RepID=UPI0039C1B32D
MSTKVSQKKTRLTVSLKDETLAKLEEVSNNLGIAKSGVIELALKNYFRNK